MNGRAKAMVVWVALAAAVGLGGLWQLYPLADASARLAALPTRGVFFTAEPTPVTEAEAKIYAGAQVVKRLVQVRNQRVVLTVIDGTHNRHAVHDPLFCFRGAGWEVSRTDTWAIERGTATRVGLVRRGERAEALFWYSDGEQAFGSAMTYWLRTTWRRLTLGASGPEPVLIVLAPVDERPVDWEQILAAWPEVGAL